MKKLLLIFLFPIACFGQHPLMTGSGTDWTRASSSSALSPTPVWRFSAKDNTNSIAIGGLVPTLTDSVQGAVMKQLSSSQQATNAGGSLGLGFWQTKTFYTNFPGLSLGTNWTVVILTDSGDDGWNIGQWTYWGGWSAGAQELTGQGLSVHGHSDYNYISVSGTPTQMTGQMVVTNVWHDAALVMDQSGNAATLYTNGIAAVVASKDTSPWTLKSLGSDNIFATFQGYWKELIIYTNALTSAQITSVHSYLTNFYGNTGGFTP